MNKRQFKRALAKFGRERAVDTAYHEAGHAVVEFLYGRARGHLVHISMVPGKENYGHARRERNFDRFGAFATFPPELADVKRAMVMREIVLCLVGPAVDALRNPDEFGAADEWLDMLADSANEPGTDFAEAWEMTAAVAKTERQRWAVLRRGARWADELIRVPRVWTTIEALAKQLKYGKVMPGQKAFEIMEAAFGSDRMGLVELGRKWKRRLLTAVTTPAGSALQTPASPSIAARSSTASESSRRNAKGRRQPTAPPG